MTRWSKAQETFLNDILKFNKQDRIDISDLKNSLVERGIAFGDWELQQLFDSLKFEDNDTPYVSQLERYANGHLLDVSDPSNELNRRIALGCGVGLTEQDMGHFVNFSHRINRLTEHANEVNCALLIDAEQTYMQAAIDSFA